MTNPKRHEVDPSIKNLPEALRRRLLIQLICEAIPGKDGWGPYKYEESGRANMETCLSCLHWMGRGNRRDLEDPDNEYRRTGPLQITVAFSDAIRGPLGLPTSGSASDPNDVLRDVLKQTNFSNCISVEQFADRLNKLISE